MLEEQVEIPGLAGSQPDAKQQIGEMAAKLVVDEGVFRSFQGVEVQLRDIAQDAGLSMLEAHRALHQLIERDLVNLEDDVLQVPDREALSAALDA